MVEVSLLEWLRSGQLGPLASGLSRTEVGQVLGAPDVVGGTSRKYRAPAIWKYGDVELHFERQRDRLVLIHLDTFTVPDGGRALALDPWIIRGGQAHQEVVHQLAAEGIDWRYEQGDVGNTMRIRIGPGNIAFLFGGQAAESSSLMAISQLLEDHLPTPR